MRTDRLLLVLFMMLLGGWICVAGGQEPTPSAPEATEEADPPPAPPAEAAPEEVPAESAAASPATADSSQPGAEEPAPEAPAVEEPKEKANAAEDRVYMTHAGMFIVFGPQGTKVQTPTGRVIVSKFPIVDVAEYNDQIYIVNSLGFLRYNEDLDLQEKLEPEEFKLLTKEEYRAPLKCVLYWPFMWQGRKYFPVYQLPPKEEGQETRRRIFRGLVRVVEKPEEVRMVYQQYSAELPTDSSWTISRWKPTPEALTFTIVKDFKRYGPSTRRVRFTFEGEVFEDLPSEE